MTEKDLKSSVRQEQFGNAENTSEESTNQSSEKTEDDIKAVEDKINTENSELAKKDTSEDLSDANDNFEAEEEKSDGEELLSTGTDKETTETDGEFASANTENVGDEDSKSQKDLNSQIESSEKEEEKKDKTNYTIDSGSEELSDVEDELKGQQEDDNEPENEVKTESENRTKEDKDESLSSDVQSEIKEEIQENISDQKQDTEVKDETNINDEVDGEEETEDNVSKQAKTKKTETEKLPDVKDVGYEKLDKEVLVAHLETIIRNQDLDDIKEHIDVIKSVFYKKLKSETDAIKEKFLKAGGNIQDFKVEETPVEAKLKELLTLYKSKRSEQNKQLEEIKNENLKEKYKIIEGIKELINSQESLNQTFQDFRDLQDKWREIGPVPQQEVKKLWESYHYQVEAFYDYIKINKELRDLDLKKNLEAKLKLCEQAEELLLEPSVVEAFRKLQILHDQWREIGPVSADKRTEIWERFKDATTKINKRHQEYFVNLKQEQKKNLEEKTILCEKAEELAALEIEDSKTWEVRSREIIELQKVWKSIGFAPKKHNTAIYERFRAACDKFFDQKREYFAQNREEQQNNLQLKTELCIQAESLQDSTDWKKTTNELIKLQKRWKEIGPVPAKMSDKIWKRFRAACDVFFNNKTAFYENIDSRYEDNLKAKEELIKEIEDFVPGSNVQENLEILKSFQRRWSEIGFVPIKVKNEIQEKYRKIINEKFDKLKLDEDKKAILKFRSRLENIKSKPNAEKRIAIERDKCFNKLKQLENDIGLWENNIGFFSESKNAESMIDDVQFKIDKAREKIKILKKKLDILDEYD